MPIKTKPDFSRQIKQYPDTLAELSGSTSVAQQLFVKGVEIDTDTTSANTGDVLTWDGTKILLEPSSGGSSTFTSDFTVTLGGGKTFGRFTNGQTVSALGKTAVDVILDAAIEYINPAFTSFAIQSQATTIEVGTALSGTKNFTFGFSTPGNVLANSLTIRDVTDSIDLVNGQPLTSPISVPIGTITNTSPITQQWRASAINSLNNTFNSGTFTVSSIYPYFWGKVQDLNAPGFNRPVANQALIDGGTKVVANSNSTITVTFNSTSYDYIWFAIPSTSTSKTKWYVNALNNGNIGGSVSAGGNLFPDFDTVSITTALWSSVNYKIYISNYQTSVATIQLRNS